MAIKVLEVDLSKELRPIPASANYDSFRILVRVKRRPIGWVSISSDKISLITVAQLHEAIQKQVSWHVITEAFANLFAISDNECDMPCEYISVIVCTRDRAKSLNTCLNSLLSLHYKNFEIIVIDNASSNDETFELVKNLGVRYVREDRPGLNWARNRGIEEAKYDLIAFTDDDVSVDAYWLASIVREFMNPKVMAVTGYVAPAYLETPAQTLFELSYGGMGHGFYRRVIKNDHISENDLIRASNFGIGANMAFRKQIFDRIGKFDVALDVGTPSSGGGDIEIFHRLVRNGHMLVYEPSILVWHSHRESIVDLKKQIFNNGRSFGCYLITCFNKRTVSNKSLLKFFIITWLYRWNLRNIIKSHLPKNLTLIELYGMLTSPIAYRKSQAHAKKIAEVHQINISVSVIIPAYNASVTLGQTLDSLLSQTFTNWEAIVVDDASTDGTLDIVKKYINLDNRIRLVVRENNGGLATARNTALPHVRSEWILFLDADDWISDFFLERMNTALSTNPNIDAVHCGWNTVTPDGTCGPDKFAIPETDMFPSFARTCAFVVHSCIIRTRLVAFSGGFDAAFSVCEDWDFWQRVSRAGARFMAVKEVLAYYRTSPSSLSKKVNLSLTTSLQIITQGHSFDPRVFHAIAIHVNGIKNDCINIKMVYCVIWFAALYMGQGQDAIVLLDSIDDYNNSLLSPKTVAEYIFEAICFSTCMAPSEWLGLWYKNNNRINEFLLILEERSKTKGLLKATGVILERLILENTKSEGPLSILTTSLIRVEVTEPILDIFPPLGIERILIKVTMEGLLLGTVELPVFDLVLPFWQIKDSIAAKFAWQILKCYFNYNGYQQNLDSKDSYLSSTQASGNFHNRYGWTEFLRQLWGQKDWLSDDFYNPKKFETKTKIKLINPDVIIIEISDELPDIEVNAPEILAVISIGGANVGKVILSVTDNTVKAHTILAEITKTVGYELCVVCVREALIGKPFAQPFLIRDRLRQAALEKLKNRYLEQVSAPFVKGKSKTNSSLVILGRRNGLKGGLASRTAVLPTSIGKEILEMVKHAKEPVIHAPSQIVDIQHIIYAPQEVDTSTFKASQVPINPILSTITKMHFSENIIASQSLGEVTISDRLPIISYHDIASDELIVQRQDCLSSKLLEEQLEYLRANNYYSVSLNDWIKVMFERTPLPGKPIALTFENGYLNFYKIVWPLLKKYKFSATVLLVGASVDTEVTLNKETFEKPVYMNREHIEELINEGIEFGSNSYNYKSLLSLSPTEVVLEAVASRTALQNKLNTDIKIFAYPFGDLDSIITHLIGACGYSIGLSSVAEVCTFNHHPESLPRIVIKGSDNLEQFISKII